MKGARVVGNVCGLGLMWFATEKAIERWRLDGSSRRTRHFSVSATGLRKFGLVR